MRIAIAASIIIAITAGIKETKKLLLSTKKKAIEAAEAVPGKLELSGIDGNTATGYEKELAISEKNGWKIICIKWWQGAITLLVCGGQEGGDGFDPSMYLPTNFWGQVYIS